MFRPAFRSLTLAVLPVLVVAGACGSGDSEQTSVAVTASDTACVVANDDLDAGPIAFEIKNEGKKVTEVYVYGPGDKVITERENIGPGTSATMNVDLAAGEYEIACKPGQMGNGIRTAIAVTGEGGKAAETSYDREVEVKAADFFFSGLGTFAPKEGERFEFKMENVGSAEHEFEVFGPDDKVLGEVGPTAAGKTGEIILKLAAAGTYRYVCDIDDHASRGMKGTFTVARS